MKEKRPRVSTISYSDGKKIDIIELRGRNGKSSFKMQPRRDSLADGQKTIFAHTKEGRIDHLDGYEKKQGKVYKFLVSVKLCRLQELPLTQKPMALPPGTNILGAYGQTLPQSIHVHGGSIYLWGQAGSASTLFVGSTASL